MFWTESLVQKFGAEAIRYALLRDSLLGRWRYFGEEDRAKVSERAIEWNLNLLQRT
jgi:methionyl-tRNA synthetase